MKIIKNTRPPAKPEFPKEVTCRNCKSVLEIEKDDIENGTMVFSQREIDHNVPGFTCPCCKNFSSF